MNTFFPRTRLVAALVCLSFVAAGCGGESGTDQQPGATKSGAPAGEKNASADPEVAPKQNEPEVPIRKPIGAGTITTSNPPTTEPPGAGNRPEYESVFAALKPLQVLVGEWNGVTSRKIKDFGGIEKPVWQWKIENGKRTALAFQLKDCSFLRKGELTYLLDSGEYQLTAEDRQGHKRIYRGTFTEPVRDESGVGNRLHRKFKLTLKQVEPPLGVRDSLAQVEFDQQDNNRYLLNIYRKAGTATRRSDTVNNLREGTSFAAKLDDYGDRTCVVTQGLGTMTVSYKGKTYYVCCSGCKKTFEDDPEMWIASFEKWKLENGKK